MQPVEPDAQGGAVSTAPRPATPPTGSVASTGRLPGLDGLRALAVAAVIAFHLDPRWLPGGFLGVDVFFVISGFLITTLLLRERARSGQVDLRGFWTRRARRLLPALLVVVPTAVLLARLTESDLLVGAGRQVLGALTFTSNWLEIGAGTDYFAATSPTLLANLWSLAVEEQFYLLWPLALLVLLRVLPSPRARAGAVLGLALLSSLLMALRLDPEHPTRVYYGTDTHATGLMVGAALALALAAPHGAWTRTAPWERHRRTVAAAALATLGALLVLADERSALTFRGGILLASLATAALVLTVVERPGRLRAVLELPAARWVGARSYGLYLWHWPVVLVVGQDLQVAPGGVDYVLTRAWALLVTFAAADLSYRFVETPVRRLGFGGAFAALTRRMRSVGTRRARIAWSVVAAASLAVAVVLATAPDRTATEELITANEAALARAAAATSAASPAPSAGDSARPAPSTSPSTSPAAPVSWAMPAGNEIDAFGDSMLVGAKQAMEYYFPAGPPRCAVQPPLEPGPRPRRGPGRRVAARGRPGVRHELRHRRAGDRAHPRGRRAGPDGRRAHRPRAVRPRRDRQRGPPRRRAGPRQRRPRRLGRRPGRHPRDAPVRRHPPEHPRGAPLQRDGAGRLRRAVGAQDRDGRPAHADPAALTLRGRGWHRGHENEPRFMNCSRRIGVPHRGHGRPCCPYAASERSKYPDAPLTLT